MSMTSLAPSETKETAYQHLLNEHEELSVLLLHRVITAPQRQRLAEVETELDAFGICSPEALAIQNAQDRIGQQLDEYLRLTEALPLKQAVTQ